MLIKCPECGKEISDQSSVCIHCGCPIDTPKENTNDATKDIPKLQQEEDTVFPRKCEKCGYTIFSSPCQYCGTFVNKSTPKNTSAPNVSQLAKTKSNSVTVVFAVILVIALIFCISQCSGGGSSSKNSLDSIRDTSYSSLSDEQKLTIIYWIESRYEYYDDIAGGYAGDKYTKTIFNEAAERYNKSYYQIDLIWSEAYELKYK